MSRKPTATKGATDAPEKLTSSIARALEAASVATDSAEEAASVSEAAEKALAAAAAAQKRVVALALGTLVSAIGIGGLGAMVYMRSLADLRQGAEIQAAVNEAAIKQIREMSDVLAKANAAVTRAEAANAEVGARIDGLGDRLAADINRAIETAGQMQPQMAVAIEKEIKDELERTRGAVLAALAEMELGVPGSTGEPGLRDLMTELRDLLKTGAAAPKYTAQNATKPRATETKTAQKTSPSKPRPRPQDIGNDAATRTPFSYP